MKIIQFIMNLVGGIIIGYCVSMLFFSCHKVRTPLEPEPENDPYKDCILFYPANADPYWICPDEK